ncbi:MAG: hypothetical protein OHK0023_25600 [Anaerolineae bacterium]
MPSEESSKSPYEQDPMQMQPRTQQRKDYRRRWPAWMQQLPYLSLPEQNPEFCLISKKEAEAILRPDSARIADSLAAREFPDAPYRATDETLKAVMRDLDILEREVMRLFRDRDREAKIQQNRYRLFQISFIVLAAIATILGSLLALALNANPPTLVPVIAFAETLVALLATFLAQISSRESPFALWLENRRAAEGLRREYFRYLMRLPPYDEMKQGYQIRMMLAERAALINRGTSPDDSSTTNLSGSIVSESVGRPPAVTANPPNEEGVG